MRGSGNSRYEGPKPCDSMMTCTEAAKKIGNVHPKTLAAYINNGEIKGFKCGAKLGHMCFFEEAVKFHSVAKDCLVCGKPIIRRNHKYKGGYLCNKHHRQLKTYGKIVESSQRGIGTPNDYWIEGDIAYFNAYNIHGGKVGTFFIDTEDVDKITHQTWNLTGSNRIMCSHAKNPNEKHLSWVILGLTKNDIDGVYWVVDHRDGNPLNNTKENLRVLPQRKNATNRGLMSNNTTDYPGIWERTDGRKKKWTAEIKNDFGKIHLGNFYEKEQAVYCRYVAECLIQSDCYREDLHKKKYEFSKMIPEDLKEQIRENTVKKIAAKHLINDISLAYDLIEQDELQMQSLLSSVNFTSFPFHEASADV